MTVACGERSGFPLVSGCANRNRPLCRCVRICGCVSERKSSISNEKEMLSFTHQMKSTMHTVSRFDRCLTEHHNAVSKHSENIRT